MFQSRIPTIEEIYQEYYRETFFATKGIYPKALKNFDKLLDSSKRELLMRFQSFIRRNNGEVDWKQYVKACAQYFKTRFELKVLGSLNGNKIYRTYVKYNSIQKDKDQDSIYLEIVNSVRFIKEFAKENCISLKEYFKNRDSVVPVVLKHIYSGTVSLFFYACLDRELVFKMFSDIPDDVFLELFNFSRNEFLDLVTQTKRDIVLRKAKVFKIINILNEKFSEVLDEK